MVRYVDKLLIGSRRGKGRAPLTLWLIRIACTHLQAVSL
jgi:hypothetical protein